MSTEAPEFTAGEEVTWTGTKGLFSRRVRIIAPRRSYLQIFGETPDDARLTYDVADPTIKGTVYGIPPEQLHAVPEEGLPMTETTARAEIAEHIRTAAARLRQIAEAATPGLWQHMCMGSDGCLVLRRNGTVRDRGRGRVAKFWLKDWKADHADAEYVATMAPPVAEALAAWLEVKAANPGDHDYGYALALAGAVNAAKTGETP